MRFKFTLNIVMAVILLGCTGQIRPEVSSQKMTFDPSAQHADRLGDFDKLLSQAICPCDKQRTLLDCYLDKSCEAARNLGEHAKAQFREGHDFEEVKLSLVNKYLNEHLIHHFKSEARPLKGDRRAPVKLVKFADFQCSHCARLARLLNTVMKELGDIASLEYRHFPLSRHSYAHYAARSSFAAEKQGKFWEMHDLLFENQSSLSMERIDELARSLGVDWTQFHLDRESPGAYQRIESDRAEGIGARITGTPSLFLNGIQYRGPLEVDELRRAIREAYTRKRNSR